MKSKHYLHGGDLDRVSEMYHIDKDTIWDFSGNINPLGISPKAKEALKKNIDLIATYPDRNYTSLKQTIGAYCHINASHVIVGNGSTELISIVINAVKPQNALVLGPTYSEYEREIALNGGLCHYYALKEQSEFILDIENFMNELKKDYDMLIVCNPNNPTGTGITLDILTLIISAAQKLDIFAMIDETYIEFCDDPSAYSAVSLAKDFDHLLVIRGVSKFFSSPGLRFGYCICSNQGLIASTQKLQNPWSINSLAAFAAEIMFTDKAYIEHTHSLMASERTRILHALSATPSIHVFKPVANFVLLKILNPSISSDYVLNALIKDGLLIRDASSFPFLDDRFIRFCFLKPNQNDVLLSKLKDLLTQKN
ncbi:MAG: hypothetical protein K0S71_2585 [Clostridia bacterium]|jgi:threonine-phosphate decarboxylase|nr:hypothetical protein [Clostridia bacterium]